MYVDTVPNRNSPPAILLREGWREGKQIRKRTLANLSDWPPEKVEALRLLLAGETMVPAERERIVERSRPHGHVEAILGTIRRLGLDRLIAAKRSRERDLVVALIAERLLHPASKLATTRLWDTTTLAEELDVGDAHVNEVYAALDWLLARQGRIEKKLARRHLHEGALALYDVSSSHYEGRTCSLAQISRGRDGTTGQLQIVYGVMTDADGRPIAVQVYPGKTADPTTVADQVEKLRGEFGLSRVVLVGDRGMLTQTQIDKLKEYPQLGWISALRSDAIRKLAEAGTLQMSLFDEQNLAEIESPEFPGERLVVCYNPFLAEERRRKRTDLLAATEKELDRIVREVRRRTKKPLTESEIGVKVGRVINRYKMAKHFQLTIADNHFEWARKDEAIAAEAALDGIYVIRTSEPAGRLSAADTVRSYKALANVERAFRTLKGIDLLIRPIFHRIPPRVRAHTFLCMLAYYVEWQMRTALAPLLFDDDELVDNRKQRDPVVPARPSPSAQRKKVTRRNAEGLPIHSFRTLLATLGTRVRNYYRMEIAPKSKRSGESITIRYHDHTEHDPLQARAMQLLGLLPVTRNPD